MQSTKQTLLVALDLLETKGWRKGVLHAPNGGYCCVGAIDAAIQNPEYFNEVANHFRKAGLGSWAKQISAWNDAEERTFDDVRQAFRRAIDALDS